MKEGDAQRFTTEPSAEQGTGTEGRAVDVLILTAVQDELDAVLALGDGGRAGWRELRDLRGFRYHRRTFPDARGALLEIAAAWTGDMGERTTALRGAPLLAELDPACLAMCGICAGFRAKTSLGDVIIADRVFGFDEGKRVAGEDGVEFFHDLRTFGPEAVWRMDAAYLARELDLATLASKRPPLKEAQRWWLLHTLHAHETEGGLAPVSHPDRAGACPGWAAHVKDAIKGGLVTMKGGALQLTDAGRDKVLEDKLLYPDGLPPMAPLRVHVAPIATIKAVHEDPSIWEASHRVERKTLGLDMEGSAVGELAARFEKRFLFMKAVSDHADLDKDDAFRGFACVASATVLLAFLQKYLEPRRPPAAVSAPPPPPVVPTSSPSSRPPAAQSHPPSASSSSRLANEGSGAITLQVPMARGGDHRWDIVLWVVISILLLPFVIFEAWYPNHRWDLERLVVDLVQIVVIVSVFVLILLREPQYPPRDEASDALKDGADDAFVGSVKTLFRYWKWLWASWFCMYAGHLARDAFMLNITWLNGLFTGPFGSPEDAQSRLNKAFAVVNFSRGLQIIWFYMMFKKMMSPERKMMSSNQNGSNRGGGRAGYTENNNILIMVLVVVGLFFMVGDNSVSRFSSSPWIGVTIDVLKALFMGLFIGRLESKLLRVTEFELFVLYAYVSIEPLFATIMLTTGHETVELQAIEVAIKALACAFKIGLYRVVSKQYESGRLWFYMYRVGSLSSELETEWTNKHAELWGSRVQPRRHHPTRRARSAARTP